MYNRSRIHSRSDNLLRKGQRKVGLISSLVDVEVIQYDLAYMGTYNIQPHLWRNLKQTIPVETENKVIRKWDLLGHSAKVVVPHVSLRVREVPHDLFALMEASIIVETKSRVFSRGHHGHYLPVRQIE